MANTISTTTITMMTDNANHTNTATSVEETLLKDAAAAVQLIQAQQQQQQQSQSQGQQVQQSSQAAAAAAAASDKSLLLPPEPLPIHWVIRESRSQPGYYYYFNYETGVCSWQPPYQATSVVTKAKLPTNVAVSTTVSSSSSSDTNNPSSSSEQQQKQHQYSLEELSNLSAAAIAATASTTAASLSSNDRGSDSNNNHKRPLSSSIPSDGHNNKRSNTTKPSQVRILHILRKHSGSRKPTSWRVSGTITLSKEEARIELQQLLDVLREVQNDPNELRATMEELARTESDCSSYKRNGDLGYFGPKKMQPTFEEAAFSLQIGELSDIVETSSGLHILLRIG